MKKIENVRWLELDQYREPNKWPARISAAVIITLAMVLWAVVVMVVSSAL